MVGLQTGFGIYFMLYEMDTNGWMKKYVIGTVCITLMLCDCTRIDTVDSCIYPMQRITELKEQSAY